MCNNWHPQTSYFDHHHHDYLDDHHDYDEGDDDHDDHHIQPSPSLSLTQNAFKRGLFENISIDSLHIQEQQPSLSTQRCF